MASNELYVGFSVPFARDEAGKAADVRRIDRLVRELTAALPVGATIDDDARTTLRSRQPYLRGSVSSGAAKKEKFEEAWELLLRLAPSRTCGVRLGVGKPLEPVFVLEREAQTVARRRKARTARELLYSR